MAAEKCDNILVRGVNWIGDAVMTMPALRAIRCSQKDAVISLLVKPWVAPLFEKDPLIDETILYTHEHKGIAGRLTLAKTLRGRGFCRAILLQNAMDAALLALLAGIPERIGYNRDGRGILLTTAVPFDRQARGLHHIDYYLNLLRKAGYPADDYMPWLYLDLGERLKAREMLKYLPRPVIGLNPGAAYGSSKRWPPERFAEVAKKVMDELDGSIVIFGGPSEEPIAREIVIRIYGTDTGSSGSSFMNLAGKTPLRELCALIAECDTLLTNDSGPMHIGYAVGTPLVAIFGSTSPELTGPRGRGNAVLRRTLDCSPCFERECRKRNLECMELVTVQDVFDSLSTVLRRKRAVFFDRDGTLCRDAHYLKRMEDLEIFKSVRCLQQLRDAGYLLIGVSNQSGVARGIVSEDFVKEVNGIFIREYGFDGFYYCPHHPDEHCQCRKPEPGMLVRASADHHINLRESYLIGDKDIDMKLALSAGALGVHVRTGQEEAAPSAVFNAYDLNDAVKIILSGNKQR